MSVWRAYYTFIQYINIHIDIYWHQVNIGLNQTIVFDPNFKAHRLLDCISYLFLFVLFFDYAADICRVACEKRLVDLYSHQLLRLSWAVSPVHWLSTKNKSVCKTEKQHLDLDPTISLSSLDISSLPCELLERGFPPRTCLRTCECQRHLHEQISHISPPNIFKSARQTRT